MWVISCFITDNWKHVCARRRLWWCRSSQPIAGKLNAGPKGTRLCLFIHIAGKHSVFRNRRQLLLQFCPRFFGVFFKRHSTISHLPHLWTRVGFLLGILPCWSLVICEVWAILFKILIVILFFCPPHVNNLSLRCSGSSEIDYLIWEHLEMLRCI